MSIALTREERKAETRRALVDAASDLFAQRGIEATSLDEVAAAVGLTKGAVYAHFPNKAALVDEVLQAATHVVEADLSSDPDVSLAQRLAHIGVEGAELVTRIPRRSILLDLEYLLYVLRDDARSEQERRELRRTRRSGGAKLEDAAHAQGRPVPLRGRELHVLLNAIGRGVVYELALDPKSISAETIAYAFAAIGHGLEDAEAISALLSKRPST